MRADKIKPVIDRLNFDLTDILKKIHPNINNPLLTNYPHIHGVDALVALSLELLENAKQVEVSRLYETTKAVKEYFTLHMNDRIFATCFITLSYPEPKDNAPLKKWFSENIQPYSISYKKSLIGLPFDYIMSGLNIHGYTDNTYCKLFAKRSKNGGYSIYYEWEPGFGDKIFIGTTEKRKKMVDILEPKKESSRIINALNKIEKEFEVFCQRVDEKYLELLSNLRSLENILSYESKNPRNQFLASYIQLRITDEKTKVELIDFIYKSLYDLGCFDTTKENFRKIFTPDNTFHRIQWEWKVNTFVHLFTGFNFEYDGFNVEFPGIMKDSPSKWVTLADKFDIKRKSNKTPLHKYLEITKRTGSRPIEMRRLLPFIEYLKNTWHI